MIFLALLYLSATSRTTTALPAYHLSQPFADEPLSIFGRASDQKFSSRSIWTIVWSCLSTIFASTWVAIHPNMPGPEDSQWAVVRRRLAIMCYLLLAPEFVIMWALRQHFDAKAVTGRFEDRPGWTRTHSFFLIMGGFTLYENGIPLRILKVPELESLWASGKIVWPTITEKEIKDKSKGDYLSKGIAIIQTTWFIIQCIVRGAYGLAVTELEVATLAFASLTGIICYLWWDKPLDVECSIPVHLIEDTALPTTSVPSRKSLTLPSPTRKQRLYAFIGSARRKHGTFLGLLYAFIYHPLKLFLRAFGDMLGRYDVPPGQLRVPTFYSPNVNNSYNRNIFLLIVSVCVATMFGSIHCIAWSFHFLTTHEKTIWRASALLISLVPLIVVLVRVAFPFRKLEEWTIKTNMALPLSIISAIVSTIYYFAFLLARLALLVLPFIALRKLTDEAYLDIDWSNFLPHI